MRHVSTDIVQISSVVPIVSSQVLRVYALVIQHAEEDLPETRPHDDHTIDQQFQLRIVFVAFVHDPVEGQACEEWIEGEGQQDEDLIG
jgi:hypothetical protein